MNTSLSTEVVPVGLPSDLLARRPDLRASETQIIAATAPLGEGKADFFARFMLLGTAARQAAQLHDFTLGMGNVFGVGPAILAALEETEDALVNYSQEQIWHERLESAVKSKEEAVQLSSETYRAGLTDLLSVLDAERELYANEDLLAQSRTRKPWT